MVRLFVVRERKFSDIMYTLPAVQLSPRIAAAKIASTKTGLWELLKSLATAVRGAHFERFLAWLYLAVSIGFVVGSVLFLPRFENLRIEACWLFIIGSAALLLIACLDLAEAFAAGGRRDEIIIQVMYIVGCAAFAIGTIFYFPRVERRMERAGNEAGGWLFTFGRY